MDSKYSIYCKKIAEINIDGEDLKYIENKNELQQWGIQKPAHKSKIWKEIQALISNENKSSNNNGIDEKQPDPQNDSVKVCVYLMYIL